MVARCYKYVTIVNDGTVLFDKHYESVLVEWLDDKRFRLIPVEKRQFVKVSDVLGKPLRYEG